MPPRFSLLLLFLTATVILGQDALPDSGSENYIEDAPWGLMGNLLAWIIMLLFVIVLCLLTGLGIALGLAILAGLAVTFGAGGVATSLLGLAVTHRPQVGWRIFSMWMHAGFMSVAGATIGGFVVPMIWRDVATWPSAGLGALAGAASGMLWGWVLALAVERSLRYFKETILPLHEDRH
jgi:hypothetical protein